MKPLDLDKLPAPNLTENAIVVLRERYLSKNEKGEVTETPKEMFFRVAKAVARVEDPYGGEEAVNKWTKTFYEIMANGEFMPNSPCLMNAGRNEEGAYSACFVLPIEDSIDGIFDTVKNTALVQKAGGGTGFSFDRLRPTGDYIKSSGGTTSGPLSFWKVLSEATNAIQQGAFRRGANMGMMSINHPDILKFLTAKQDLSLFTNYNISVKIPDAWMKQYTETPNSLHIVTNFRTKEEYAIPKSITGEKIKDYAIQDLVPLKEALASGKMSDYWTMGDVFQIIKSCAWNTGEPGLFFIDAVNAANPTPHLGDIEASNPCGEQPLLPYESCNLGSINVKLCVSPDGTFDWEKFKKKIAVSTRFLDDVVDASPYPIPEISEMCHKNRKIGLGVMGFADALYLMGIPYNSDKGVSFGRELMRVLNETSQDVSSKLAEEKGNFPAWEGSLWETVWGKRPMRNSVTTTVAPTGTISIIADCSGGIEPLFSLVFFRNVLNGKKLTEVSPIFMQAAKEGGFYSEKLEEKILAGGSVSHIEGIPSAIKKVFVCSHDITPKWHLKMQAAFQDHCGSSISKTINLPSSATEEDVEKAYILAWNLRCKGVTVYRDGCRSNQPMSLKDADPVEAVAEEREYQVRKPVKTPALLSSVRLRQNTPHGNMHVNISVDPRTDRDYEIFAQLGKAGDIMASDLEAMCRLASLYLRIGGSLADIQEQLTGIGSNVSIPTRTGKISSLADGLGHALKNYLTAKETNGIDNLLLGHYILQEPPAKKAAAPLVAVPVPEKEVTQIESQTKCPSCGVGVVVRSEGCLKCSLLCGYSKCG